MFYSLGTRISFITGNNTGNVLLRVFIFGSLLYLVLHYYLYSDNNRWEVVDKMKHYIYYAMFVDFVISYLLLKWNAPSSSSEENSELGNNLTQESIDEIEKNYRELRELRNQISPAEQYRNKKLEKEKEEAPPVQQLEEDNSASASQKSPFMTRDEIKNSDKDKNKEERITERKEPKKSKKSKKEEVENNDEDNVGTDTHIPIYEGK